MSQTFKLASNRLSFGKLITLNVPGLFSVLMRKMEFSVSVHVLNRSYFLLVNLLMIKTVGVTFVLR